MSRDVLDLIDHVVAEHELLSADAMRWAPDAPDPTLTPTAGVIDFAAIRYDDGPAVTVRLTCTVIPGGVKLGLDTDHLRGELLAHGYRDVDARVRQLAAVFNTPPRPSPARGLGINPEQETP